MDSRERDIIIISGQPDVGGGGDGDGDGWVIRRHFDHDRYQLGNVGFQKFVRLWGMQMSC